MRRRDLIRLMERNGWHLERNGASHDIYRKDRNTEMIPRHSEIKEQLAKAIIKKWGLK